MIILPVLTIVFCFYDKLASLISQTNPIIYDYAWILPVIAILMAYFEIFYAWVKVHFKSVYGNFIKEVLLRVLVSLFLIGVYFEIITIPQFVYSLILIYGFATILMGISALSMRKTDFKAGFPKVVKPFLVYSSFIIFSSGIAVLLLDIDKFMLGQYVDIKENAYYSVAIFIALTISVPMRAMHQIVHPITTHLMSLGKYDELNDLYKKTSITLQSIGGYIMIGILINIHQVYTLLPEQFQGGIVVVFIISFSKFFDLMLGNNNSIIFNSKYYTSVLFLGLGLIGLTVVLNMYFIPVLGIKGAAISTLIAIGLYSFAKLMFVIFKMNLYPFTRNTLFSLGIILFCFVSFYYWDFSFNAMINIALKSTLFSIVYWLLNYYLKISPDINTVVNRYLKR